MTTALIVLAIVIAAPLLYLATLDGSYSVRRSLDISVGRKAVFDKICDFRSWPDWSPWLMHEPDARLVYSDKPDQEGGWYTWDGKTIGAGKLIHEKFIGEERIEQKIEFTRPFKSVCKVWWELEQKDGNKTRVYWNMAGKMPFLFRFMAKKMPEFIGKDYDTGLYMLRRELDTAAEAPRISFDGLVELPNQTALTIHFEGHREEMKKSMMEGFPRLGRYVDENKLSATGYPFTIYHQIDAGKMHFNCDLALPVPAETRSAEFAVKSYTGGRYYKTTLKGSYEFLQLTRHQTYSHLQMQKIKPDRKRASLEMYENDPATASHTNDIVSSIYIPIK